jgi:protein-L-isoaspartate(D-aspartate) O-methyltransferase
MTDLTVRRRFYAEEVQIAAGIRSACLVEALATVPRERFLPPGPWTFVAESDRGGPPRRSPDDDPRHVYHNVAIGIAPERMLFNGAPGVIAAAIDALGVGRGDRVLHLGSGTGYYTALIAQCVGPGGRVVALEVDERLAACAAANLAEAPWVDVRCADGSAPLHESFDAALINAGVTHPLDEWLDAVCPSGRIVLPLTFTMPAMGNIGKGLLLLLTATPDRGVFDVRVITFVAIFSAAGVRDDAINREIGKAFAAQPFPRLTKLRRNAHPRSDSCWLHAAGLCLSV